MPLPECSGADIAKSSSHSLVGTASSFPCTPSTSLTDGTFGPMADRGLQEQNVNQTEFTLLSGHLCEKSGNNGNDDTSSSVCSDTSNPVVEMSCVLPRTLAKPWPPPRSLSPPMPNPIGDTSEFS